MKTSLTFFLVLIFFGNVYSQVGIGTTTPNAQLEISASNTATPSNTDGLLIPKIDEFPATVPTTAQDGMLVFVTGNGTPTKGFYYWDQGTTAWIPFVGGGTSEWVDNGPDLSPIAGVTKDVSIGGLNDTGVRLTVRSDKSGGALVTNSTTQDVAMYGVQTSLQNNSTDGSSTTIGNVNQVVITGVGSGFGEVNSIGGAGSGLKTGVANFMSGTGSGSQTSFSSILVGAGQGNQVGISNDITNSGDAFHTGLLNSMGGSGSGVHVGVNNSLYGAGVGRQSAIENVITNSGDGDHVGQKTRIDNAGNGFHTGVQNELLGSGDGGQTGTSNYIFNSGAGNHIGSNNWIAGDGSGNQFAVYNALTGNGDGPKTGNSTYISGTGDGNRFGNKVEIVASGDGVLIGTQNEIRGANFDAKIGTKNIITATGETVHIGTDNQLSGLATGPQYGTQTNISISSMGAASHYGAYIDVSSLGFGYHYGNYINLGNAGGGNQYGTYTAISNSGNATHYGAQTILSGSGTGLKYGNHILLPPSAGGTHYGLYSEALKTGSYAGYFLGSLAVGTTAANTYTLPASRGTNGQIMQTDASGNVSWISPTSLGGWSLSGNTGTNPATQFLGTTDAASLKFRTNNVEQIEITETGKLEFLGANGNVMIGLGGAFSTGNGGGNNIFIGALAGGTAMTTGAWNIGMGEGSLGGNITGQYNVSLGRLTLRNNTSGHNNIAFGRIALNGNTTGNHNLVMGEYALENNTTGSANIALGYQAGQSTQTIGANIPDNNIIIGNDVDFPDASGSNQLNVGNLIYGVDLDGTNNTISTGNIGIAVQTPTSKLHIAGDIQNDDASGNNWRRFIDIALDYNFAYNGTLKSYIQDTDGMYIVFSDRRLKKNITSISNAVVAKVMQLNPVNYSYTSDKTNGLQHGFVAQEVQKLFPELVHEKETEKGTFLSLNYQAFGVLAIKTLQEQQKEIDTLKAEVSELKKLEERIKKLEMN